MKIEAPAVIVTGVLTALLVAQTSPIRINQVGYELHGPKAAIYQADNGNLAISTFKILSVSNQEVFTGTVTRADTVDGWVKVTPFEKRSYYFWKMDFSDFKVPGTYRIECNGRRSFDFDITEDLYFSKCMGPQLDCFVKMRNKLESDRKIRLQGSSQTVNLYGGYNEASGDASKHITHLQYANYLSTQETPLLLWALLRSYELNRTLIDTLNKKNKLFDEAAWGCDYLVRAQAASGYFYATVFNQWDDTKERVVCAYEVISLEPQNLRITNKYETAFREGGGLSIAALAKAAAMGVYSSGNTAGSYLNAARKGYDHIKSHNIAYCDDGKENIIDDYCALVAAIELFKATNDAAYKSDAGYRVDRIMAKQDNEGFFWADDARNRPFYHASDEGMPLCAMIYYMEIDSGKDAAIKVAVKKAVDNYMRITGNTNNPFNYVRMFVKPYNHATHQYSRATTLFFMPKDSNETRYWFQGENARLASMTTAFLNAAGTLDANWKLGSDNLSKLAMNQLDWILGKNPFEICMFYGEGLGIGTKFNPRYIEGKNYPGGICNGITGALPTSPVSRGIEWAPANGGSWTDWRWLEQWLPHEAWFFLATATLSAHVRGNQTGIKKSGQVVAGAFRITIKPWPANGRIHFSLTSPAARGARMRIFTLRGKLIGTAMLDDGAMHGSIDIREFSSAMHLVEFSDKGRMVRQKITIVK